jgi:hypothetical protein
MKKQTSIRKVALGILGAGVVAGATWWAAAPSQHAITAKQPHVTAMQTHSAPSTPALAQTRVRLDDHVTAALVDYATRPATAIALDPSGAERGKAAMRAWTSRVTNLDNANRRQSTRFDRTSYTDPQARDVPMHLGDRRAKDGSVGDSRAASAGSVSIVYRESTNGREMMFEKLGKDQAHKATGSGLPEKQATEQARTFMVENGLIAETGSDLIGRVEVRERHENQEEATSEADFLVQQDLVLRRTFEGKPVINASASIGVLPAGNEVVSLKVANWTPVSSSSDARTEIKPAFDGARAKKLAEQLQSQLVDVLKDQLGQDAEGAVVKDMEESWFASDRDGLIPALVFVVELGDSSGDRHTVAVAMTPYHDSAQIWQQGRKVQSAAVEPTNPE